MSKPNPEVNLPPAQSWGLGPTYLKVFSFLVVLIFLLIGLGGSVRIMNAGLACPDWPLCFGNVIPDYHPQVYFEFIHRVVAGLVSVGTAAVLLLLWRSKAPLSVKRLGVLAMVVLLAQIIFGGLTVLLSLQSMVVAGHLTLGTTFFAVMLWTYLCAKYSATTNRVPTWYWCWSIFVMLAVFGQILLGGMVAAHFASLACTDFPKCQGEWFPTFHGIIGLHIIHRLGAYTVALVLITGAVLAKNVNHPRMRGISRGMAMMVLFQLGLGIANVLFFTPPLIAVAHLMTAMAIFSLAVRQVFLGLPPTWT